MGVTAQLWAYQELDLELDKAEAQIKALPSRRRLVRLRNTILEQQKTLENMEKDILSRHERVTKLEEFYAQLEGRVNEEIEEIDPNEKWDIAELEQMRRDAQELMTALDRLERELDQTGKDMAALEAKMRETALSTSRNRKDFPVIKEQYENEVKKLAPDLEELKRKRDSAGEGIDQQLLKRYHAVKAARTPALATVVNDQCSGCNMSLPSQVARTVKAGAKIVECENCGRILCEVG